MFDCSGSADPNCRNCIVHYTQFTGALIVVVVMLVMVAMVVKVVVVVAVELVVVEA